VVVADNGTVLCEASLKDLTRISLKDDQFASVSKVQTASPLDDFQVVNEPLRGDIYLSVASGFSKPTISFFGTSRKGHVYKFVCAVGGQDAKQVFVTHADPERQSAVGEPWSSGLSRQEEAARLIAAMYGQRPVEGFDVSWRPLAPVNADGIRVQRIGHYESARLTGKLVKLTNIGVKPVTLREEQLAPEAAIAVSITNPKLAPGEETTAFIVLDGPQAGERP